MNLRKFDIKWELDSNLPIDSILAAPDLHFVIHPSGLHVLETNKVGHCFVQTVEDNLKLFKKQQISGATQARNVYELLHCPSQATSTTLSS